MDHEIKVPDRIFYEAKQADFKIPWKIKWIEKQACLKVTPKYKWMYLMCQHIMKHNNESNVELSQ